MLICAIFLSIIFSSPILSLDFRDTEFSINYFKFRDVRIICLLTCEDNAWTKNFAKKAARQLFRVSAVNNVENKLLVASPEKLAHCLHHNYSHSVGVLVDASCPKFDEIMVYASANTLLDFRHQWLILNNNYSGHKTNETFVDFKQNILDVASNLNMSVDADILLATRQGDHTYNLRELFNFGKIQGGDLIVTNATTWSSDTDFDNSLNEYKYYRRWDFKQWKMRMISVVTPAPKVFDPKILTDRNPTPGVATITRTSTTILDVLADIHNLRFVHSIADRWVDDFNINKSKAVVASSLCYRHQDISPIIRFLKEIHDNIDIVHPPLTSIETRYYYRIPTYGAGKFENQFLRPLSTGAWISMVVVTGLCALVLLLSARQERRPSSGQYAIFSVIASICQQFFDDTSYTNTRGVRRTSAARKLTIFVTGISCVLIYNYYTSSVVSWLLNGPPPSINSLQELLDSPLELIFEDVGYTRSWLQTPIYYFNKRNIKIEDELRKKKVLNKKKDAPLLKTVEEGIRMVKAGGFAYHTEIDNANRLISRTFTQSELCELGSLSSIEQTPLYACLQKNSPYMEFFVWSVARLKERGIMKCIQHRTIVRPFKCEGSSPRALALGGAAPAFLLLVGGYLLATVIMLAERAIWKYKNKKQMQVFMKRNKPKKFY